VGGGAPGPTHLTAQHQRRGITRAKLGSTLRPITVWVQSDATARYVAETCEAHGWYYLIGFETDQPEDISALERALIPQKPVESTKIGRNEPCPCGSGRKYKKCCGAAGGLLA